VLQPEEHLNMKKWTFRSHGLAFVVGSVMALAVPVAVGTFEDQRLREEVKAAREKATADQEKALIAECDKLSAELRATHARLLASIERMQQMSARRASYKSPLMPKHLRKE
jgi:hypothetical protein